jgi:hypothetical protein
MLNGLIPQHDKFFVITLSGFAEESAISKNTLGSGETKGTNWEFDGMFEVSSRLAVFRKLLVFVLSIFFCLGF